ncbi:MAG: hypothetical protein MR815_00325 [Oscillospiraceae bacterium]|nr:hypothetical protein [Oscillospiraceae bacterium]
MKIIRLTSPDGQGISLSTEEELERAPAARALPFPLDRKRKKKGPFCTALRQRQNEATIKTVRRDAQKLAASRRSNNLCARFFTARVAVKKSPHEPRSKRSAMLPRPSVSAQRRRFQKRSETMLFGALFSLLRPYRQVEALQM